MWLPDQAKNTFSIHKIDVYDAALYKTNAAEKNFL